MKMYTWKLIFIFCVFIPLTYQGVPDNENVESNDESSKLEDESSSSELGLDAVSRNQSELDGPPDSHEAMNNRELKPKLTIGNRRKRSYEFLVGLVKRNSSLYQITKNDETTQSTNNADAKASELLLELLVKIAENPQQWSKVHELLQKLDKDLIQSKALIEKIKNAPTVRNVDIEAKRGKTKDQIDEAITPKYETTKYPWQLSTKPNRIPGPYQNFAYHRVTGNPLTHSPSVSYVGGSNKNPPKAYIAVSVIAPKPVSGQLTTSDDEVTLENELKELKPWSHQQNLKNMAEIRSRWVIQNDEKPLYAP